MTIKLVGTSIGTHALSAMITTLADDVADLEDDLAARLEKIEAQLVKVKDDTDGALLMLEGRIHELETEIKVWKEVTTHMNEQLLGMNKRLLAVEDIAAGHVMPIPEPPPQPPATSAKRSAKS